MVKALLFTPDDQNGRVIDVEPTLKQLQFVVGGDLESVSLRHGHLYCDELGKIKGLAMNNAATRLARKLGWLAPDVLVGPVIFLDMDEKGDDIDVPEAVLDAWGGLDPQQER